MTLWLCHLSSAQIKSMDVLLRGASERTTDTALCETDEDAVDARIRATDEDGDADDEDEHVQQREADVLDVGVPCAFFDNVEPEESGEGEAKGTAEETGDDAQEGAEEGDGLCDHPRDDDQTGDQAQPDAPALLGVDEADIGGGEEAAHEIFAHHGGVDTSGDEDDGEGDTERYADDFFRTGKQGRAGHVDTDKGVDDRSGQGVDEDFNCPEQVDGFDIV